MPSTSTTFGFPERSGAGSRCTDTGSDSAPWGASEYKWRAIGLEIDHELGRKDSCDPTAPIVVAFLTDNRWHTDRGLHVGDSLARLRQLYPKATHDPGDWYLERSAATDPGPILMGADVRNGRVTRIYLHVDAARA